MPMSRWVAQFGPSVGREEVMEGGDETNHRQQHSFGEGRNSAATAIYHRNTEGKPDLGSRGGWKRISLDLLLLLISFMPESILLKNLCQRYTVELPPKRSV